MLCTRLDTQVLPAFDGRILPIDTAIALRCARLHVPDPKSERDAVIAATTLVHGMTVVTRNVDDFKATGVPLINLGESTINLAAVFRPTAILPYSAAPVR